MIYNANREFILLDEFIKNQEEEKLRHKVILIEYLSISLNIACALVTSVLAYSDKSIIALAIAIDTLLDVVAAVVVIWRFRRAEQLESLKRNNMALISMSLLFFLSSLLIEFQSVKNLILKDKPLVSLNFIVLSLTQSVVFSLLSVCKFALAQKLVITNNSTLVSDGINSLLTSLSSLSMAISMSLYFIDERIWYFDSIFGFLIGICIFFYGCHLFISVLIFRY